MPPASQIVGFFAMIVGMFMAILDIQIVSSSLSEIQAGLSASADQIAWVQSAYLIAEVVAIPLSGFLSRLLSTRVLFTLSAAGFTLTSLGCASVSSFGAMVVLRALQGFLGGAMIPTVFATSFAIFPASRRNSVSVMIGLVATLAPTLGPTLGGYITELASWHWLFLINLFPGVAVALVVWRLADFDRPDRSLLQGFDLIGLLLMALFLGSVEYVLEEGARYNWFDDAVIARTAVVAVVAGLLFFWRMLSYARPIVDLRAFADRNFSVGCVYSFVIGIGLYGATYLMPLFLAQVRGLSALQIGHIMFVTGAFQFLSAPIAGRLAGKLDLRVMLAIGLTSFGAGLWMLSDLTAQSGFWELFLPQAVRGISLMFCFIPVNALALGTLPPDKLKNASGLYNLMRNFGGAIGLAVINTILIDQRALHGLRLGALLTDARAPVQEYLAQLATTLGPDNLESARLAAMQMLSNLVAREANVLSFSDALLAMAAAFGVGLLLMPLVHKPRAAAGGGH